MMITKKKPAEPTVAERERAALIALGEAQGWPSVSLDAALNGPDSGLPDGLPQIGAPPATVAEAKAEVEAFTGRSAALKADLDVAFESGDADRVLEIRRQVEELTVRRWAAQRSAVQLELAHYEAELERIGPQAQPFRERLEAHLAHQRTMRAEEVRLADAVRYADSIMRKAWTVVDRLHADLERLQKGPAATVGRDGWR